MFDLKVINGHLVKPFDINCKDKYIQCVADYGVDHITLTPITDMAAKIFVDSEEIKSKESVKIRLKENGYGYVMKNIEIIALDSLFKKSFIVAVKKPAPNNETLYSLENRPQFHYTAPYGYLNDPNGMVYDSYKKEYHLFYQAYPYTQNSGPKHWGHATTTDLVTFKEHNTALYPDENGCMWSGTAIIDYNNTAKFYDEKIPSEARILLIYFAWENDDSTGAGIAYTSDYGETWIKAENGRLFNFIGAHPGHIDPKVFWDENLEKWIMICASGKIFTSKNLWDWNFCGEDQWSECPDIYKLKIEGTDETKYVRTYGGTDYRVGDLRENSDGSIEFVPETDFMPYNGDSLNRRDANIESILQENGWFTGQTGSFYAAQHYQEAPDNRIISVGWIIECGLDTSGTWAGAMSVATEQKLYKKKDGRYILHSYPVKEIDSLHGKLIFACNNVTITPNSNNVLENVSAIYADIDGNFVLDKNVTEIGFKLRKGSDNGDITVRYDVLNELLIADYSNSKHSAYNSVRTMSMKITENRAISIRILLDNIIVESFGNSGEASICSVFSRDKLCEGMELYVVNGNVRIEKLNIYDMKSIWKN